MTDKSTFSQGFLKLLRVQLLNRGVTLATGATEVELPSSSSWRNTWSRCLQARLCRCTDGPGRWRGVARLARALPGPQPAAWNGHAAGRAPGPAVDLSARTRKVMRRVAPRARKCSSPPLKTTDRYLAGSADLYYIERGDALFDGAAASTASAAAHAGSELARPRQRARVGDPCHAMSRLP